MKHYLSLCLLLVVICHNCLAVESPMLPEPLPDAPVVHLPPDTAYSIRLLHAYNAQADNPNLLIPDIEKIILDAKNGLQAWLPCVPDPGVFTDRSSYPIYRSRSHDDRTLILLLPPDQQTQISQVLRERIQRFVNFTCQADGYPIPRAGKVSAVDYRAQEPLGASWLILLGAGLLALLSALLTGFLFRRR
jgi:hypothetical protein